MDNIVWVIVASAVIIALAGILLYLGSTNLGDIGNETGDIIDRDPEDHEGIGDNFLPESPLNMEAIPLEIFNPRISLSLSQPTYLSG